MNLLCILTLSAAVHSCLVTPPKRSIHVWSGECPHWGSMREVMHEGKTQARVSLAEAAREGRVYGVGALANLAGEVFIEGGDVWVSRVVANGTQETRKLTGAEAKEHFATLLIAADVPAWEQVPLERDVPAAELDGFLAEQIKGVGHDLSKPTPLLMVGPFVDVRGHIANGHCPGAPEKNEVGALPEFAVNHAEIWGRVVGFYAEGQEGVLTHHGSKVHLHFLSDEPRLMMHADTLGLKKGSVLFLPIREGQHLLIPQKEK